MRKSVLPILLCLLPLSLEAQLRLPAPDFPIRPLYGPADTLEVIFIGDVMMHSKQLDYDWNVFLEPLRSRLEGADLAVANMEFPLGGKPYTGYPSFSTPESYADCIADFGIDVFLVANNHVLDRGKPGLEKTLRKYRSMKQIRFTGAASDPAEDSLVSPLVVVVGGIRIALLNMTYGTNQGTPEGWPKVNLINRAEMSEAFRRARQRNVDYIVALPHWGIEYDLRHSSSQASTAAWLVSQGADAVIGAHPHVVQDSTWIRGVPVFYSLGNAVSNMSATNTRLELAVTLRFARDIRGDHRMLAPKAEFLWCTLPGKLTDSYATIAVRDYIGRRELWKDSSDYDNMMATYARVRAATGIIDQE